MEGRILADIYRVGLPTIVTQALGSIMLSAINAILMPVSSTDVAFFGVYYKLQNFLFMPMNGLGQAAIPIVGYNFGAGKSERVRAAFYTAVPIASGIALLATAVFCAIPEQLLCLFDADTAMLELGVPALRIISCTFVFSAVTTILGYAASGIGNGLINMVGTGLEALSHFTNCVERSFQESLMCNTYRVHTKVYTLFFSHFLFYPFFQLLL